MARVLRNRAIVIAEDDQATTAIDSTPLQTAGSRTPFNEKDNNEVAMTVDEIEMEQELKELKAAYKVALNGKKKRKPRKGKKAQEEIGVEVSKDEIDTLGQPILITEAVRPGRNCRQLLWQIADISKSKMSRLFLLSKACKAAPKTSSQTIPFRLKRQYWSPSLMNRTTPLLPQLVVPLDSKWQNSRPKQVSTIL